MPHDPPSDGPPANGQPSAQATTHPPPRTRHPVPVEPDLAQLSLAELERTDPAVKAGAEAYDRGVAKILTGPTEPTMVTFGRELRDLRVRHGLSLRDLARMLRTEDVALANVERGVVARPQPNGDRT